MPAGGHAACLTCLRCLETEVLLAHALPWACTLPAKRSSAVLLLHPCRHCCHAGAVCVDDTSGSCSGTYITPPVQLPDCPLVDLCFLLDDSGSIKDANAWPDEVAVARSIIVSAGAPDSEVALYRFCDRTELLSPPAVAKEDLFRWVDFQELITGVPPSGGSSTVPGAVAAVEACQVCCSSCGYRRYLRHSRPACCWWACTTAVASHAGISALQLRRGAAASQPPLQLPQPMYLPLQLVCVQATLLDTMSPGSRKVMVILTDFEVLPESDAGLFAEATQRAKESNITVLNIGVGEVKQALMYKSASSYQHVFVASGFDASSLQLLADDASTMACTTPPDGKCCSLGVVVLSEMSLAVQPAADWLGCLPGWAHVCM